MNPAAFALPRSPAAPAHAAAPRLAFALLLALLVALQFGPALGLLGFRLTQNPGWALLGLSRDVLTVLFLVAALGSALSAARAAPLPSSARWALVMAAVYVALAVASPADAGVLALNLRRLLLVPLLFVALLWVPWTPRQLRTLMRVLLASSIAVAVLGLAERLAPETLWLDVLDVVSYASANPLDPFGALPFHDSGRFFSWDLERWTGGPVRRVVSTYLEPTTLAAAMAAGLMLVMAERARGPRQGWVIAVLVLCGLLTLAKSYWLFLAVLLCWRGFGVPAPCQVMSLTAALAVLALGWQARGPLEGALEHIGGLASAVHYLAEGQWLGEGLGMAGNYASGDIEIGAESGLGNVIAQVGVAAILPLWWVRCVATDVLHCAARRRDAGGVWLAGWLLFWLVSFLFSASSLGIGGNALGFMMLALYLHPAHERGRG